MLFNEVAKTIKLVDEEYNVIDKIKAHAQEQGIDDWRSLIFEALLAPVKATCSI